MTKLKAYWIAIVLATGTWACGDDPEQCVPVTCGEAGKDCGAIDDGCGGTLACGTCAGLLACGAVEENVCGCGSAAWATEVIDDDPSADVGLNSSIRVAANGDVHVSYIAAPNDLRYASRASAGGWASDVIDTDVAWNTSVVLTPDGAVHVAYFDSSDASLKHAERVAPAGPWMTEVVDDTGDFRSSLAAAATSSGTLEVVYLDNANAQVKHARRPAAGVWTSDVIPGTDTATDIALAVDAEDGLHLAFLTSPAGLSYGYLAPGASTWAFTSVTAAYATDVAIAVDEANAPHIAYAAIDSVGYAPPPSGTTWSASAIPGTDGGDNEPSITVGRDASVHVIYRDSSHGHLREARRTSSGVWMDLDIAASGVGIAETPQVVQDAQGSLHAVFEAVADNRTSLQYGTACVSY